MSGNAKAKLSKAAIRAVAKLYPRPFRDRFSAEIAQTFADMIDDVATHGRGILLVTIAALYDASIGIAKEWSKEVVEVMFATKPAKTVSLLLSVPFVLLVGLSLSNSIPSWLTFDGQQVTGIGRVFIFVSVLLLPVSLIVNIVGIFSTRQQGGSLAVDSRSSILLLLVQAMAVAVIGAWIITEATSCTSGLCD